MKKKILRNFFIVIIAIILIVFLLFVVNTIRKLAIIKDIQKTASQYTSSTNYHIKSVANVVDEDYTTTLDYYVKDNKQVSIMEKSIDGKVINKIFMYDNGTRKDTFYETEETKRVDIDSDFELNVLVYDYFADNSNMQLIYQAIVSKIEDIEYNGKECYRIVDCPNSSILKEDNGKTNEVYIEKSTGLVIRTHFGTSISEREYEFNNVQNENFIEPDISQYELVKNN